MKSALQLELQNLHGLPYFATIIWFVLLGVTLFAIVFYLFQKTYMSKGKVDSSTPSKNKSRPKGF